MRCLERFELGKRRLGLAAKARQLDARQRLCGQARDRERIAVLTIDAKFIMDVRAGCKAGHADKADRLPLDYVLADLLAAKARHVTVQGRVSAPC